MAKKKAVVVEGVKEQKVSEIVKISRDTSDAEILRLNADGVIVDFGEPKEFRELPDSTVTVLSHENARRYWMAFGVWKDRMKKPERAVVEEIIDPLVGHEAARMSFSPRGKEGKEFLKRNHLAWMFSTTVPGMKQQGYKEVSEEDPVDVGITSNASGHYLTKDLQGRDELLLMKVDMMRFNQHERAVSEKSQRAIRGARGQFEGELDRVSRGKVKPMREDEEDQSVEKVKVTRDNVDRAFLKRE